jgi:hypothetical protein
VNRLEQLLAELKAHPQPEEPVEYLCAACRDTGYVETDDGLEDGKRVRAPQVARCTSIAHERVVRHVETVERFS